MKSSRRDFSRYYLTNQSTPVGDLSAKAAPAHADTPVQSDLLFDFINRTNGSFSEHAVENALKSMFKGASSKQIEASPQFLADLAGLGLTRDEMTHAKAVVVKVVASASSIDKNVRDSIVARIEGKDGNTAVKSVHIHQSYKLAQDQPIWEQPRRPFLPPTSGGGAVGGGGYH